MFPLRLSAKFLLLVLGILVVFFGILSFIIIDRETDLLTRKAVERTSGYLRHIPESGLRKPRGSLTVAQKSAAGIVVPSCGGANAQTVGVASRMRKSLT